MSKKSSKKRAIVWGSVTAGIVALLVAVNVVSTTVLYPLLNTVMPGGGIRPRFDDKIEPLFVSDYSSKEEAMKAANETNVKLCEEGITLLKNENGALPVKTPVSDKTLSKKPKISIFGKNSVDIAYGGSGSGAVDTSNVVDLYSALEEAGYEANPVLKSFYENISQSGAKRQANSSDLDSGESLSIATAETPQVKYTKEVKQSYGEYNDAALVVFTRIGGEGFDLPRSMKGVEGAYAEDDTYLQLDKNERDMLTEVCNAGFKKVIVIINSGATMELTFLKDKNYFADADKIDAAVWMGYPGMTGTKALGEILNGSVNPSGKTVDTYASNLKAAPSFQNFGDNNMADGDRYFVGDKAQNYYFVDYEESIYVGYKYYETRGAEDAEWYNANVVYPFGYGLSYTSFDWEIADQTAIKDVTIKANSTYTVKVTVTNSGTVAGKDVVQLYAHAPYTKGGIEKSEEVLVGFAKTPMLYPVSEASADKPNSCVVELSFDPYYLASYDYKDKNGNGFCGYELEAGNGYQLYVAKNAHDKMATIPFNVDKNIKYDRDPVTKNKVSNLFTDQKNEYFNSDYQLKTLLSRADWEGTFPTAPTKEDRTVDNKLISALADVKHNNPNDLDNEDMPWFDEDVTVKLRDLLYNEKGELNVDENGLPYVDYEDERWLTLMEECNADELIYMISYGAFTSAALDNISKPATNDTDGPVGFVNFMDKTTYYDTCSYCCEVVIASTWNVELAEEFGKSVGNEGIWGDAYARSNGMPYSGWYAPGANIHRSPFGGRNFEYFSEDGFLTGKMAASQIKGCQSKGVYCAMKHFALNEQETHRSINGDSSWVTEQAMREIYLRPFEIAVKEGETRAIMSSFNRIGTRWTGGDYRLLTSILRDEWGFKGFVVCDFNTSGQYMNQKQMHYAGGDLNLSKTPKKWVDTSDTADCYILAQCAKNVLYTVVQSNAMNREVIGYRLPRWTVAMIIVDCAVVAGLGVWGVVAIKKYKKTK